MTGTDIVSSAIEGLKLPWHTRHHSTLSDGNGKLLRIETDVIMMTAAQWEQCEERNQEGWSSIILDGFVRAVRLASTTVVSVDDFVSIGHENLRDHPLKANGQ